MEKRKTKNPALLIAIKRRDASGLFKDWDNNFFENDGLKKLGDADITSLPLVDSEERWAAPVARPGKAICIGLNYSTMQQKPGL